MAANVRALCRCGIRISSARNHSPAFDKVKCLEPMFGDAGQAQTNAAMLLMPIDTTSSRTFTKPIVACWRFLSIGVNFFQRKSPNRHNLHCILWQVPTNELRKCPHYLSQPCLLFLCAV